MKENLQLEEKEKALINNAKLPAFVIRPVLVEICNQLLIQEQQQYKNAMNNELSDKEA